MLILPILSVFTIYLDICIYMEFSKKIQKRSRLLAALYSISIHTLIVLASNEFLSLFHEINFISLSLLWIITSLSAVFLFISKVKKEKIAHSKIKTIFFFPQAAFTPIPIFLFIICCTAFFLSLRTTPYNWDSMTYHLTRLTHWTQNSSIAHYVCHDISQISTPPLAEFVNLHVYILSGQNDHFVNLLQTFSYIVSVFLVYKISRMAGCKQLFSSLAALVFATTPIAFAEALTTQVDMFSGLWLLVFVYSILLFTDKDQKLNWNIESFFQLLLMGGSAGFCYLSKPSTMIAVPFFTIWLLLICIHRHDKFLIIIKSAITVLITGMVIILPELVRNIITFHSISSAETSTGFLVPSLSIRYLLVNLIQNIGFNMPSKYLNINHILDKIIFKSAYILYAGESIPNIQFNFSLIELSLHHDTAINPIIIWLLIFAVVGGFITSSFRFAPPLKQSVSCGFILSSIFSFLAFCMFVQWYKFITRYEIGYLALLAPAIMLLFQYIVIHNQKIIYVFAGIVIFVCSISFVDLIQYHKDYAILPETKEIRVMQYFSQRGIYWPYREISDNIIEKEHKNIGFLCGSDSYEYPFWKMLENSINRFEHVCVDNETEIYDDMEFLPDCIISVDVEIDDVIEYHNVRYELVLNVGEVKLFERE